jgi:tRNA modification GTPase
MYVLRDIKLKYEDLTAQIDYVIITPVFIYYVECKNLIGNIKVNEKGDFIREYYLNGKKIVKGMYSPLRQVEAQREVVRKIWNSKISKLTKIMASNKFDYYRRVLVVAANHETILDTTEAPADIKYKVIKADSLIRKIKYDLNNTSKDEIIDSKTDVSQNKAVGRLSGKLYEAIDGVKKHIVDTLAAIEVEIEYPEDEETIADSFDSSELKKAEERLSELAASWKSEKIYQDGARVVLCGRTNAGKSSLFNALLKEDRAIVSDIEGTTRDFIESWIDFSGIPARLFDTAGLRETSDMIEAVGVERTKDLSEEADLILYLVDSKSGLNEEDRSFIREHGKIPLILVWNKCDAVEGNGQNAGKTSLLDSSLSIPQVSISAKKGIGLGKLSEAVRKALSLAESSDRSSAGLGSERQKLAVEKALESVRHALSLTEEYALDAVVQDLEDSLDSLGEVTGDVTPDDVLASIFANFCVGK